VARLPHQVKESEAVGGPSCRLSSSGSPAGLDSPNGASGARSIPPDRAPRFWGSPIRINTKLPMAVLMAKRIDSFLLFGYLTI
jgi:hypothetical protein